MTYIYFSYLNARKNRSCSDGFSIFPYTEYGTANLNLNPKHPEKGVFFQLLLPLSLTADHQLKPKWLEKYSFLQ